MADAKNSETNKPESTGQSAPRKHMGGSGSVETTLPPRARAQMLGLIDFLDDFSIELETALELYAPNPFLKMATHLIRSHIEGRTVTPSSLAAASGVPYATATRRMDEMKRAGLIEQRAEDANGQELLATSQR